MRKKRLWWQLFLSYLWVPVIVLLLIGWYGSSLVGELYRDHLAQDLKARARLCLKSITPLLLQGQMAEVDALCKELGRSSQTRITVVLPSGKVVGDSNRPPGDMDNHRHRPEIEKAFTGRAGRSQRYSSTEREEYLYLAIPCMEEGKPIAVVRTSLPATALTRTLGIVHTRLLLAMLVGMSLHIVITMAISRRLSHPLEEVKEGAKRFAAGDLGHRLQDVSNCLEMETLTEAMNRMAEQLDERLQTVLRQQNEREAMLASMEEGVLAIDNDGMILSVNSACASLLGEGSPELQGRNIYDVIRKAELLDFVETAISSTFPIEGEIQIRGTQDRWVSAHGTALYDAQRGKIGVLVVLHDITRLRHLEEVRRDFVANVSHELRTPITSIKGFVETLLEGAYEDKENAQRFLQIMLRQVNRLDAIIGDLLMLSRIERGFEGQRIELASELIQETLQAAIEMCAKKAHDKSIDIELTCPGGLTAEINAALFEQAVINLLDNAIKYSNSGARIEILAAGEGTELVVQVKDHGCGIESRHLSRLFERFYRVDKARSRELGGTGLGLAIVRHIVLAHRGSVSMESTVGVGSTFCLRVPISSPPQPH